MAGRQAEETAEVAALADEADMPLEALLARYGYVVGNGHAAEDEPVAAAQDEEGPGAQGRGCRRRKATGYADVVMADKGSMDAGPAKISQQAESAADEQAAAAQEHVGASAVEAAAENGPTPMQTGTRTRAHIVSQNWHDN